jgi:hypothetical protein
MEITLERTKKRDGSFKYVAAVLLVPLTFAARPSFAQTTASSTQGPTSLVSAEVYRQALSGVWDILGVSPSPSDKTKTTPFIQLSQKYPSLSQAPMTVGFVERNPDPAFKYPADLPAMKGTAQLLGIFPGEALFAVPNHVADVDTIRVVFYSPKAQQPLIFSALVTKRNEAIDIALAKTDLTSLSADNLKRVQNALHPIRWQSAADWRDRLNEQFAAVISLTQSQQNIANATSALKQGNNKDIPDLIEQQRALISAVDKLSLDSDDKTGTLKQITGDTKTAMADAAVKLKAGQFEQAISSQTTALNNLSQFADNMTTVVMAGVPAMAAGSMLDAKLGDLTLRYHSSLVIDSHTYNCKFELDNASAWPGMSGSTVYWGEREVGQLTAAPKPDAKSRVLMTPESAVGDFFMTNYPAEAKMAGVIVDPNLPNECRTREKTAAIIAPSPD